MHSLVFTVFSYSFLTLKKGKINSGIATGKKQRYTLYRHFSIITLGVWNIRLNHIKFLMFNWSGPTWHYESTLQVTSEHHLKFQVLLTHQIFTRTIKNSNLDTSSLLLLLRVGYWQDRRLQKVNMDKRGEQEGNGKKKIQIITKWIIILYRSAMNL